ncbi:uncharacterized protein A1O9_11915 [Exophiala aquamarina CBS 119918]|uniref:Ras guanine-nucleotide exchange protein Cdc25p n=1 Tax=Exophiala aquamarina CBS 119918 TaxID=1182545 RepID=A0A072NWD9_9EURO|nr:uncharacterized protein A1O9_11915 [Exophiala aquamarina CBS 119918]KEF51926.1 hypothetical protein A1O9_11915 [Exophiala aquamarina CBS 119918]
MRETQPSSIFVAPLRIRKSSGHDDDDMPDNDRRPPAFGADSPDDVPSSPARFHNYLRALYPFQPSSPHSSTTVTLPLNSGDIILIHSIHVNGWADGTLLDTGARGWLPTNYCEGYDYAAIRPLLRALTEFWDIVRCGGDSNLNLFRNQDYMRGLVAGVRALLEKSECLTRDSSLVKQHEAIRRSRKSLLSDLALLVRTAKQLQQVILAHQTHTDLDIRLDDMLLKAFRIVTRAVLFFDVWSEQVAGVVSSPSRKLDPSPESLNQKSTRAFAESSSATTSQAPASGADFSKRISMTSPGKSTPVKRRSSVAHRMSYSNKNIQKNPNLISELLHRSYDDFLTVLASFLGSHMQSRSSSELLLTTQNAVRSCRQLFTVVEAVIDRDHSTSRPLVQAKDSMYYAITELVHAARQVFKPLHSIEDDLVYLPEEAHNLVQAATACVSAAGRCVARTKATLEEIGDFEIENLSQLLGRNSDGSSTPEPSSQGRQSHSNQTPSTHTEPSAHPGRNSKNPPRISISHGLQTPPLSANTADSPSTAFGSVPPTPRDDVMVDLIRSSPLAASASPDPHSTALRPSFERSLTEVKSQKHPHRVVAGSTSSDSSFDHHSRLSDPSNLSSASTRVTSIGDANHGFREFMPSPSTGDDYTHLPDDEVVEAEILTHTFVQELVFNREGSIVGGSLNALIERLTAHDSAPDVIFISTIYLTFRLFAKPEEFAQALAYRFDYVGQTTSIANPVRLRVYNVMKGWMESHWRHDIDDTALPVIVGFARESVAPVLPMACKRLLELAEKVSSASIPDVPRVISVIGKTSTSSATYIDPSSPLPVPIISKSQLAALKTWKQGGSPVSILDFDPLELARQITLKTSKIFCSILPEELLATEWTKRTSSLAVNVRAMSTLSTDVSNLVSDSVLQLEEPKKRAAIIKQWVKIANKCLELHNYDTLMAIVCSLDSTNLKRMRKTWEAVPPKTKTIFEDLRKVVDISRNYAVLRQRVQSHLPPCLPFIGVYLTDLTMVDSANPSTRPLNNDDSKMTVINLDKHIKTAKIISALQKYQIPYRLTEVSELQTWMQDQLIRVRSAGDKSFHLHYRRSLVLEPKEQQAGKSPNPENSGKDRDKFDFLNWAHLLQKEKSVPVNG